MIDYNLGTELRKLSDIIAEERIVNTNEKIAIIPSLPKSPYGKPSHDGSGDINVNAVPLVRQKKHAFVI